MSDTITVRRNWKKKIDSLCDISTYTIFSLDNDFSGVEVKTNHAGMVKFVETYLSSYNFVKLKYNKDTGKCTLDVHSNLWYEWECKIEW